MKKLLTLFLLFTSTVFAQAGGGTFFTGRISLGPLASRDPAGSCNNGDVWNTTDLNGNWICQSHAWVPYLLGNSILPTTALAFSATPAFNASFAISYSMTLTGNVTSSTISGSPVNGGELGFHICQNATGGFTFVWPANFLTPPTIQTGASLCTDTVFKFDGTNWSQLIQPSGGGGGGGGSGTVNTMPQFATPYGTGPGSTNNVSGAAPPAVNGNYVWGYQVVGGIPVQPLAYIQGIPVFTPSTPYTGLYSDRGAYQRLGGGTTFSFTLPQITGNTAFNFPMNVCNLNSGLLTFTANAADKIDNSATGGTSTLPAGWCAFVYQDQSSAPGNWWTVKYPQFAAPSERRSCDIAVGDQSGAVITNAQLGPQSRLCYIPFNATILEMDVNADGGTPSVIVGKNSAGTILNIVSSALATAATGGIACSNAGGTTGINGVTTCSNTLQNTALNAGDYLELVSGTAGGVAKLMGIHIVYVEASR